MPNSKAWGHLSHCASHPYHPWPRSNYRTFDHLSSKCTAWYCTVLLLLDLFSFFYCVFWKPISECTKKNKSNFFSFSGMPMKCFLGWMPWWAHSEAGPPGPVGRLMPRENRLRAQLHWIRKGHARCKGHESVQEETTRLSSCDFMNGFERHLMRIFGKKCYVLSDVSTHAQFQILK